MPSHKLLLRVALRLRAVYLARAVQAVEQTLLDRLAQYQRVLERTRASVRQSVAEGWPASAAQVRRHLQGLVRAVHDAVRQTSEGWEPAAAPVPDLRSLVDDLRQLEDEFGGLRLDFKEKLLSVTTEPIRLEATYLGPFTIQLSWTRLARDASSYGLAIVAEDPHPAATNEAVTHPHVNHGVLCAGDATVSIQRALEQGRLADAFCLVRSVLRHYNPSSPHVALEDWGGQDPYECGGSVPGDDLAYCESCGHDYCPDCVSSCAACHETRCYECLQRCPRCDDWYCPGCLTPVSPSGPDCCDRCDRCLRADAARAADTADDELDPPTESYPSGHPETDPELPSPVAEEPSSIPEITFTETVHAPANLVPLDA